MILMVDARTMGSQPSGIGMYLYNFLKEIVKVPEIRLVLVSDVATSSEILDMKERGVEILLYGKKVFRSGGVFAYFNYVRKQAKKYQPDLFWEPNILIPLPMHGYHGKIVLTIHDIFPITAAENYGIIYRIYFRFLLNKSIKQADLILYDSDFSKKETEKYSKPARKKKNFLTYVIINKEQKSELNQSNFDNDYFLYVGYLGKRKGTDILIRAYESYVQMGGCRKLYLAGGVNDQSVIDLLEETNAKLKGANKATIEYLGYISKERKAELIENCACFLFPSRAEGFGMPIIEVMEYYRPVIASDLEIFKELIGDTIGYYQHSDDIALDVDNLAKAMYQFDDGQQIDSTVYDEVIDRYRAEKLGLPMIQCLLDAV